MAMTIRELRQRLIEEAARLRVYQQHLAQAVLELEEIEAQGEDEAALPARKEHHSATH